MKNISKQILYWLIISVSAVSFFSCDKFLEIEPKGFTIPDTDAEFNLLLNGERLPITSSLNISRLTDDYDFNAITPANISSNLVLRIVTWQDQFQDDITAKPFFWSEGYLNILYYNTVIIGTSNSQSDYRKQLKAEAMLGRAYEYYYLVNLYGLPYSETNKFMPGVPYVTSNSIDEKVPPRSTIDEIYNYIFEDIRSAIPDLPESNAQNRFRGSKQAAYSVLARVFLSQHKLDSAAHYASRAIDGRTITDFTNFTTETYFRTQTAPSTLYFRIGPTYQSRPFAGLELMQLYKPSDTRLFMYYENAGENAFKYRNVAMASSERFQQNAGTSVEEMKLIIAETAARKGDISLAMRHVNDIEAARVTPFVPLTATTKEQAIKFVLDEKRKEFPHTGLRWFEMRRLSELGEIGTITRLGPEDEVVATLPAKSPKYALQIPLIVQHYNPEMELNKR